MCSENLSITKYHIYEKNPYQAEAVCVSFWRETQPHIKCAYFKPSAFQPRWKTLCLVAYSRSLAFLLTSMSFLPASYSRILFIFFCPHLPRARAVCHLWITRPNTVCENLLSCYLQTARKECGRNPEIWSIITVVISMRRVCSSNVSFKLNDVVTVVLVVVVGSSVTPIPLLNYS